MEQILHQVMDDLMQRIREAITFYREHFPANRPIKDILLCGGGANFKYIDQYLSDKLKLTVKRASPWRNAEPMSCPLKPNELISFATAVGLALRNLSLTNHNHD